MPPVTKVGIARGLVGFYITVEYLDQMKDNYRKGDWLEAGKDTAFYTLAMAPVIAPKLFWGTVAYPVTVGVAVGFVATVAIVELTGIGEFEDVVDMYLNPVETIKELPEAAEVVGNFIVENVTDPAITALEETWQTQLVEPVGEWVDRRKKEVGGWTSRRERDLRRAWEITRPRAPTWL